jgi:hypothetical protein
MARFPANEIISLIRETFRYHFGESVGRDLRLGDVLGACAQRKLGDSVRRFEAFRFRSMTATGARPHRYWSKTNASSGSLCATGPALIRRATEE